MLALNECLVCKNWKIQIQIFLEFYSLVLVILLLAYFMCFLLHGDTTEYRVILSP